MEDYYDEVNSFDQNNNEQVENNQLEVLEKQIGSEGRTPTNVGVWTESADDILGLLMEQGSEEERKLQDESSEDEETDDYGIKAVTPLK